MPDSALSDIHSALQDIRAEIRHEGSEFDFRYSLVDHLFTDALGWSRTEGEGHVNFEDDRKDLLFFDDSDPPFPVVVCETKRPSHDLALDDVEQLETYLNGVGSARYGILTNGHEFRLYEYLPGERSVRAIADFDVDAVAGTVPDELTDDQRSALGELEYLRRDRYVNLGDAEHFRETYQEVPVRYDPGTDDEGYELFLDAVKGSLDELTDVLQRFFEDYRSRDEDSYPREFLESTFPDWQEWREYTGKTENAQEAFCRETAYIILNRTLFARIAEDKEIVGHTRLSSRGMADALEADGDSPYLDALMDTYDQIDDHYPDLYELGIFDWWWVSKDKRGQFSAEERRRQHDLESELDYTLGRTLKRLNRFDFERVNRDILGHVYEDYLPKKERKELGEYYTPLEVVQFMLDSVDYRPDEGIGQKTVLDPACGSGTFLTEVVERLIQHFVRKFNLEGAYQFDADQARTVLERIEANVYGIDINPFAAHITQINLLFRTIDLYDAITEKDPYYTMEGFEIHVADTLSPTAREQQASGTAEPGEQSSLEQFAAYNGRARSFIEDRDAVDRIKDEVEFDVVVANPPYVRIQNLSGMKEVYGSHYESAIKNFDIYVPFIERGLEWLTDDGKLAYICPDRLINADYGEAIRQRLVEDSIVNLIDFKEASVFDVPTPYPCIITLDRDRPISGNEVQCARFSEREPGVLDELPRLDEWETPDDRDGVELFEYEQKSLEVDNRDEHLCTWKPMPVDERRVFDKLEEAANFRVKDVMDEVFQGLATSADKVYTGHIIEEMDDGLVQFRPTGSNDSSIIEKDLLRRLLKGNEIKRWKIDWQGLWVVFPYDESTEKGTLLSKSELQDNFPHAWEFFLEYEEELKSRESGRMRGEPDWYGYIYPKNLTKFHRAKIMLGVLRQEPSFVPDPEGDYYFVGGGTAGGYGLHVRSEYVSDRNDLLFYSAILNSRVLEFYHKHISFIFNSKYYSYGRTFLEPHPLVNSGEVIQENVVEFVHRIKDRYDEVAELGYRVSDIRNYLTDFRLNSTILDLAESVDLTDDDYRQGPIRTNEMMEVDSERIYQVVLKQGHTLNFEDERIRDFVFELLTVQDKRLGRSEIMDMRVPEREDILALMEEYEEDQEVIEELEREAEELQSELDEMIQREVYMLDDEDVGVIDDFLEVW